MKKKLLASVLTIAMFAAIVGCGSSKTTEVPAEKATTEAVKAEETTTEAPEVATTEAEPQMATEKVEVDIDPENYIWQLGEGIIYFDGTEESMYYKKYNTKEEKETINYSGEDDYTGVFTWTVVYSSTDEIDVNQFIKFTRECEVLAEEYMDESGIIGNSENDMLDDEFTQHTWNDSEKITYSDGFYLFEFYNNGSSICLRKVENETEKVFWDYPLSKSRQSTVNDFIKYSKKMKEKAN